MNDDHFAGDVPAMMHGAANLDSIGARLDRIIANLGDAFAVNSHVVSGEVGDGGVGYKGGGADSGQIATAWYEYYKPGEAAALELLGTLQDGLGNAGNRIRGVGQSFEDTNSEATGHAGSA